MPLSPLVRLFLVAQVALFIGAGAQPISSSSRVATTTAAHSSAVSSVTSHSSVASSTTSHSTQTPKTTVTSSATANTKEHKMTAIATTTRETLVMAQIPAQGTIATVVPPTTNRPTSGAKKGSKKGAEAAMAEGPDQAAAPATNDALTGAQIGGIVLGGLLGVLIIGSLVFMCRVDRYKGETPPGPTKRSASACSNASTASNRSSVTCVGDLQDETAKRRSSVCNKSLRSEPSFCSGSPERAAARPSPTSQSPAMPTASPVRRLMAAMARSPRPQTAPHRLNLSSNGPRPVPARQPSPLSNTRQLYPVSTASRPSFSTARQPSPLATAIQRSPIQRSPLSTVRQRSSTLLLPRLEIAAPEQSQSQTQSQSQSQLSPARPSAAPTSAMTSAGSTWRFKQFITLTPKSESPTPHSASPPSTAAGAMPLAEAITPIGRPAAERYPPVGLYPMAEAITPVGLAIGSPLPDSMVAPGPAAVQRPNMRVPIIAAPKPPSRQPTMKIHIAHTPVESPESPSPLSATTGAGTATATAATPHAHAHVNAFPRSPLDPGADDVDVRDLAPAHTSADGRLMPGHAHNGSLSFSVISVDARDSIVDSYMTEEEVLSDHPRRW